MFRQSSNNQQFGGESAANKIKLDIPEQSGNVDDTDSFSETDIMGVGKYLNEIREKDIKSNNGSIFESSKPIFERFIKELDKITDSSKKEKISEIIKKLEETDVTFNKVLKKIIDTYDINDIIGTKTFIDFQFKMYEA